jgi:hypothetical protein
MAYTFDSNVVSDLHKEAYGFRPGQGWWAAWKDMDDQGRQEEWDRLSAAADEEALREQAAQQRAEERWNLHIAQLMRTNGIDRATALRWDMDAMDCDGDAGFYCYKWGIGYRNEEAIRAELAEPVPAGG